MVSFTSPPRIITLELTLSILGGWNFLSVESDADDDDEEDEESEFEASDFGSESESEGESDFDDDDASADEGSEASDVESGGENSD